MNSNEGACCAVPVLFHMHLKYTKTLKNSLKGNDGLGLQLQLINTHIFHFNITFRTLLVLSVAAIFY